nr:methyltransferase domain-containing protein [uncultured Sulfurimonas sp.]
MKISSEFSKHAKDYDSYSVIQNKVIKRLLKKLKHKPKNILDLGCGSGALHNSIDWSYEHFTGVDFAPGMLELHPKTNKCECVYGDFNDKNLFENLLTYKYDHLFSASALQWAENLDMVFQNIKSLNIPISLAIFTKNTFKTLNETASLTPILRSYKEIDELQKKYFDADFEVVEYRLEFESTRDIFRYIKNSGVSGSRKVLDYKQTKKLMQDYPLKYLEFEVVFICSR